MPRIPLLNCSKLAKIWKNDNAVIIYWHGVMVNFFWLCSCCLLNFLVTGSSFMAVSLLFLEFWQFLFIGDLTRNMETGNTPAWALSNIWRLKRVRRDTTFCMCLMKSQLMLQNARFTTFIASKLLRKTNMVGEVPHTQIKV